MDVGILVAALLHQRYDVLMQLQKAKLEDQIARIRREGEERAAKRGASSGGVGYFDPKLIPVSVDAIKLISEDRARRLSVAAIRLDRKKLTLAALNPDTKEVIELVTEFKQQGFAVTVLVASQHAIEYAWGFYHFVPREVRDVVGRVTIDEEKISALTKRLSNVEAVRVVVSEFDAGSQSVIELLEVVLAGALANQASDVHFEAMEDAVKLRYRVDGILLDVTTSITKSSYASILSRIKLLSELKINVSDRPQDGRFTIGLGGKDVEVRVATAPAEYGEIVVLRVLDPDTINLSLADLGLRPDDLEIINTELKRPNGMILNTGPTGSGKTTTLYAFLKSKANSEVKVITIEDPIEYHLAGIEQTQVDRDAGYSFANGLRSIMRQDPDVIFVGEVRDKDTAEIAIQAALTGHLVLSTIHANEAAGAIPRLLDLGVRPTSIGPALNLVIAQRLVRRLCVQCRKRVEISAETTRTLRELLDGLPKRVDRSPYREFSLFEPRGCPVCHQTGYRGRMAIFELLLNDPEYEKVLTDARNAELKSKEKLEQLINESSSVSAIIAYARERGMVTMQEDGLLKVVAGITSFTEIAEATGSLRHLGVQ